jgi:hypothetical protein
MGGIPSGPEEEFDFSDVIMSVMACLVSCTSLVKAGGLGRAESMKLDLKWQLSSAAIERSSVKTLLAVFKQLAG